MTIWPVDAEVSQAYGSNPTANLAADSWLIQTFGNYQPNGHTGVDFPVGVGTPVRAAASGTVKHVGWYSGSYADNPYWISPSFAGYVLVIDHGSFVGIYAHLSGSPVTVGQSVSEGQVVAQSGNSGGSTGPHLHFEVLPDGWDFNNGMYGRVNPAAYITGGAALAPQSTTTTEEYIMSFNDKIQEYQKDGKTKAGIKTAAFILGNLNQWVTRILEIGSANLAETKAARADIAALRKALGK